MYTSVQCTVQCTLVYIEGEGVAVLLSGNYGKNNAFCSGKCPTQGQTFSVFQGVLCGTDRFSTYCTAFYSFMEKKVIYVA